MKGAMDKCNQVHFVFKSNRQIPKFGENFEFDFIRYL